MSELLAGDSQWESHKCFRDVVYIWATNILPLQFLQLSDPSQFISFYGPAEEKGSGMAAIKRWCKSFTEDEGKEE